MSSDVLTGEITALLAQARGGDRACFDLVFARLYPELRRLARVRSEGGMHGATTLVHECYLRLAKGGGRDVQDRPHFMATAARTMRSILVDRFRSQQADKRGAGLGELTLGAADALAGATEDARALDLLALDSALDALDRIAPAQRELVELHVFGGLELQEIAELRGISEKTAGRHWQRARAFLRVQLDER